MNDPAGPTGGFSRRAALKSLGFGLVGAGLAGAGVGSFLHRMSGDAPVLPLFRHDWTELNPPWAYESASQFTVDWPSAVRIVDLRTASSDFFENLLDTVNAAGERCVVRLGEGVHSLRSFRPYGRSGDPAYSFGFFHPDLRGLLGEGADKTFVEMAPGSMTREQLGRLSEMTTSSFDPLQMGLFRFDGSERSPVLIGGVTFRAADQQPIERVAEDVPVVVPQPAPHNGVVLYAGAHSIVSHTRFQAAGRALTSQPPFETANLGSARGAHRWRRCEFDGRRAAELDPTRPRRCAPLMGNNETVLLVEDCWLHHSNVSRYAVNDENHDTRGSYTLRRVKAERISDEHNTDPALNDGRSLGGWTNASLLGWESCGGEILVEDCLLSQDNGDAAGQVPAHLQLTSAGERNPSGGRLAVRGGTFRNRGWPHLDGYVTVRIGSDTRWWRDGLEKTLDVRDRYGRRLLPHPVTGTWPPSPGQLEDAGVTSATHYLVNS